MLPVSRYRGSISSGNKINVIHYRCLLFVPELLFLSCRTLIPWNLCSLTFRFFLFFSNHFDKLPMSRIFIDNDFHHVLNKYFIFLSISYIYPRNTMWISFNFSLNLCNRTGNVLTWLTDLILFIDGVNLRLIKYECHGITAKV